ncbi:MAG: hypothetical protein IPJ20_12735 [Flammeovirgaceae bacterium]|nr:hypothetical protein [Flammeovirgaceae bacterium]
MSNFLPRAQLTTTAYTYQAQSAYSISDGAVTSAKIADGAITNADINVGAAIADSKLATITTAGKVSSSAISGLGSLAALSIVNTTQITDGTIATIDLADNAVTTAKILDGTIATADLANDAVTSAKIFDGTILGNDISASAAIAGTKISPFWLAKYFYHRHPDQRGNYRSPLQIIAPKTKYLSISSAAFPIVTNSSGYTIASQRFLSSGGSSTLIFADGNGFTPIYLPDGATVTNLTFSSGSCDGSDGCNYVIGGQVVVRLLRQPSSGNLIVLASATAPAQTGGTTSTSVITNGVIDNGNYSYQLRGDYWSAARQLLLFIGLESRIPQQELTRMAGENRCYRTSSQRIYLLWHLLIR